MEYDAKLTDKDLKEEMLILENTEFKSTDFESGVYDSVLKIKFLDENYEEKILAEIGYFHMNGEVVDIEDAADSYNGDAYLLADTLINYLDVAKDSNIAILDFYNLYSSKITLQGKVDLLLKQVLPYLRDIGIKYIGFFNLDFVNTDDIEEQRKAQKILDEVVTEQKETDGDDWKTTVSVINVNYETDKALSIDPFLEEYKKETNQKLPDDFEDKYDDYIFDEDDKDDGLFDKSILDVYKFKKNIYYSEDGRRINITNEDRNEMKIFKGIRSNFENIENLFNRIKYSYKNMTQIFDSEDQDTDPNTVVSAFLSDANMFIDYLEKQWIPHYVPIFKKQWKNMCTYIYDNNLGYRLCYNLRNYDQHPQGHSAQQIIKEVVDDVGEKRVEYFLNVVGIYRDDNFYRKMKNDLFEIKENDEFSKYARNYMINIISLYNSVLAQFLANNLESLREVYNYLIAQKFNRVMIKSVDSKTLRIEGSDYADDVISTVDIDDFLNRFETKGIINKQLVKDIRNGNDDTPDLYLTPEKILKNIVINNYLGK